MPKYNKEVDDAHIIFDEDEPYLKLSHSTAYYVLPGNSSDYPLSVYEIEKIILNHIHNNENPTGIERGIIGLICNKGMSQNRREMWYDIGVNPVYTNEQGLLILWGLKYIDPNLEIRTMNAHPYYKYQKFPVDHFKNYKSIIKTFNDNLKPEDESFTIKLIVYHGKTYVLTDGSKVHIDQVIFGSFSSQVLPYVWDIDGHCTNGGLDIIKEYQIKSFDYFNKDNDTVIFKLKSPAIDTTSIFIQDSPGVEKLKTALNRKIDNNEKIPVEWVNKYNKILDT